MRVGDVGEFGLIGRIERAARSLPARDVVIGIGDDAAVLRSRPGEDTVATTDALVDGVHFRFDTESPHGVGRRSIAAALSDLAAMGARPVAVLLALELPPRLELRTLDALLRGLVAGAAAHGCPLAGGNVARSRQLALTLTALGAVPRGRALTRDAARPGDRICVTGRLGGAALALARAKRGVPIRRRPVARLEAGRALARSKHAGACIDVSDGLVADLRHVARASRVGAEIDPTRVPRPRGLDAACRRLGLDPARLVLESGEEYELLFTLRPGAPGPAAWSRRLGVPVREIGRVTAGSGIRGLPPRVGGWTHF